jgi:SRSO17 transposase
MRTQLGPEVELLAQLDEYLVLFRGAFRRRDQARWAAVYLQGLLADGGRKNMESLARRVVLPPDLSATDVAQALQNFVNRSPWGEEEVWRRYRDLLRPRLTAGGVFVVEELDFPKQGRHSVGVHHQHSAVLGRKINCQSAVSLHYASPAGCYPLALRLYLPRRWVHDPARLEAASVPPGCRRSCTRSQIALELLDRVRAEGWSAGRVEAGPRFTASQDFLDGLEECGLGHPACGDERAAVRRMIARQCEELGLDHFEGRSWRGFHHHACLVMLAFGFRAWQRSVAEQAASTRGPASGPE